MAVKSTILMVFTRKDGDFHGRTVSFREGTDGLEEFSGAEKGVLLGLFLGESRTEFVAPPNFGSHEKTPVTSRRPVFGADFFTGRVWLNKNSQTVHSRGKSPYFRARGPTKKDLYTEYV